MRAFVVVAAVAGMVLAAQAGALRGYPGSETEANKIASLIRQLGDDAFAKRMAATKELEAIGEPAVAALREAAASSDDLEIKRRAERIMDAIAKATARPVEVDFATLPTGPWYTVVVRMECESMTADEPYSNAFRLNWRFAGDGPTQSRDSIEWYFEAHGWSLQRVGKTKLVVADHGGRRVTSVKIWVEGIPASMAPIVACRGKVKM